LTIQIRSNEIKVYSQNGEDGILAFLFSKLSEPNCKFIEIGCSDGLENNSRNLIELGLNGTCVDISWKKLIKYRSILTKSGHYEKIGLKCMRVTFRNAHEILRWHGLTPDIFSLDIDSYDYFIIDKLLRSGFRPSIVCLEVNSFMGDDPVTVDYSTNFSRYGYQPDYGLYFGASPAAFRLLLKRYGYLSLGMDSSGTNMFFVMPDRLVDPQELVIEDPDTHQRLFVAKYQKSGAELSNILLSDSKLIFHNINQHSYETRFRELEGISQIGFSDSALFVTTFIKKTYDEVSHKLIESFNKYWPKNYELLVLGQNCDVVCPSNRVLSADLETSAIGLSEFKTRHRFNPGANGHFGAKYYYSFDCVKWSHKVFASEVAMNYADSEFVVYIDSDILTLDDVPADFLISLIPDDADIAYMPQNNMPSECSFVIYRQRNPMVRQFMSDHAEAYRSDIIFQLPGWTDCHIFDFLVQDYKKAGLINFHNINEGVAISSQPFVNGPLGRYMDHIGGIPPNQSK
jgi:hypothetical protein